MHLPEVLKSLEDEVSHVLAMVACLFLHTYCLLTELQITDGNSFRDS